MEKGIKTIGEELSIILNELEGLIWEHEFNERPPIKYDDEGVRGALKIFTSVMLSKMWELQENEKIDQKDREVMAEKVGTEIRKLVKVYTGIETFNLYKNE